MKYSKIQLDNGRLCIFDTKNVEQVLQYVWSDNHQGYAVTRSGLLLMHRMFLPPPEGKEVDHLNGDTLDNRLENLRAVTRLQNIYNRRKTEGLSSRFKGVWWAAGAWHAQYSGIDLGRFHDEEKAARAYDAALRGDAGKYGRYNFPKPNEQSATEAPEPGHFATTVAARLVTQTPIQYPNRKRAVSGYRGVYWDRPHQYWYVQARIDGETHCLGVFKDKELAAVKRDDFLRARTGGHGLLVRFNKPRVGERGLDGKVREK